MAEGGGRASPFPAELQSCRGTAGLIILFPVPVSLLRVSAAPHLTGSVPLRGASYSRTGVLSMRLHCDVLLFLVWRYCLCVGCLLGSLCQRPSRLVGLSTRFHRPTWMHACMRDD